MSYKCTKSRRELTWPPTVMSKNTIGLFSFFGFILLDIFPIYYDKIISEIIIKTQKLTNLSSEND